MQELKNILKVRIALREISQGILISIHILKGNKRCMLNYVSRIFGKI